MAPLLRTRLISPYQHEGVKWLLAREEDPARPGGFLCDEMGLGKTVQLIATMLLNPKPHTLVVVPKSIVGQWCDEIKRFAPSLSVASFDGAKRLLPETLPNVVVAPYSILPHRVGSPICPLLSVEWDRVILDEGHEIRNKKSKSHIACAALRAPIRWVVSGTPVFNSIKDFVALCSFVGIPRDVVQGYTDQVRDAYVLRRTKESVAKGVYDAAGRCIVPRNARLALPPCEFENIELEMFPEEKVLYEEAFSRGQDVVREVVQMGSGAGRQMMLLEALLRVRQVMTWPQLYLDGMAIKEDESPELWAPRRSRKMETLISNILEHPKEKALIFTQFMGEMDHIQEMLTAIGLPVFRIDGSVLKEKREEAIAGFKGAPPGAVFLIQIKAGGVGLNLQEATRVYITAPSWSPATELQAVSRAHRTGQTQKVTVRRLIYVGSETLPSVEQSIVLLQESKSKVCAEVLNDPALETQVPNASKTKITIHALRKIFRV